VAHPQVEPLIPAALAQAAQAQAAQEDGQYESDDEALAAPSLPHRLLYSMEVWVRVETQLGPSIWVMSAVYILPPPPHLSADMRGELFRYGSWGRIPQYAVLLWHLWFIDSHFIIISIIDNLSLPSFPEKE
jgi:hypothetical protein